MDAQTIAEKTTLTERQAQAFVLHSGGHSIREIADEMGVQPQTVHDHLEAMRQRLRESRNTMQVLGEAIIEKEFENDN